MVWHELCNVHASWFLLPVIVPVYNAARYIRKTIDMVCEQTYKDWELILVDDASHDNSAEIISEIIESSGKRIRLIRKEINAGAAEARNTGIDASAGRYIAFLDADDVWMPDKLEKQIAFMEKTGASFAFHSYEFGDIICGAKEPKHLPRSAAMPVLSHISFRRYVDP